MHDNKTYKIPNDYTVEEVERILEKQIQVEKIANKEVDSDKPEAIKELNEFWDLVFAQIEILFQHYHPEMTGDKLRKLIRQNEALKIIGFHKVNRYGDDGAVETKSKKKIQQVN